MNKKFTFGRLAACLLTVMAMLPMAANAQECQFTPAALPGQADDRTATEVSATVHVGEWGRANMTYGSMLNLASTNPNAVAIFRGANVFFVGVGNSDVTYTEKVFIDRENFCTTDHTIHYTVAKGNPTANYLSQGGLPITEDKVVVYGTGGGGGGDAAGGGAGGGGAAGGGADGGTGGGDESASYSYTTPALAIVIKSYNESRGVFEDEYITTGITYNSSNPAVATIDANGQVTVTGTIGETTISATWAGNANWNAATASYVLIAKKQPTMYFDPYQGTDTVGNVLKLTPVIGTPGVTVDAWESTRPEVATVDNEGNVTMLKAGTAYIEAIYNGNAEYHVTRARFYLTVAKAWPHISFTPASMKLEQNVDEFVAPAMYKPDDLTETYSTTYEWFSSDATVATVNSETGVVALSGGLGTTAITYAFKGDDRYLAENARYFITVETSGLYINDVLVTSAQPDVLGDGSVIYSKNEGERSLTLTNLNYNANGKTFIRSSSTGNLNVYVVGNCYITNAAKGIDTEGPLYIWCANKKDSINISASQTAIHAEGMKVIDCYLFANGGQYGIFTNTFAVWAGGYIFAQGTTEAIRTYDFQRGMANMGGIEVLTKGVTFVEGVSGGFFTDYPNKVKAKNVEIGKIPLPITAAAVTDIDFDGEDENPYDNLKVVFSESKDDGYNETEKQIEISTTITDDEVETTLEAYVACSSDFLKDLPGVLVFDVPAGSGSFEIQCHTLPGYKLQAKIEGATGTASIVMNSLGWATVYYNVLVQTHVIVYLQEVSPSHAPAKAPAQANEAAIGAYIKAIKITPSAFETPKYYVVGTFSGWNIDDNYRMVLNEGATTTEYMIDMELTTTDQFKVVERMASDTTWFPDLVPNYGANNPLPEDGNYTVYFRPNGDGYGEGWYYNVIYVAPSTPSAIEETNADPKAAKFIRNGQLFIEKNGKTYNAIGVEVK